MAKRNDQLRGAIQAIGVAVTMAILSAGMKAYFDLYELKAKFEYIDGKFSVPPEAK